MRSVLTILAVTMVATRAQADDGVRKLAATDCAAMTAQRLPDVVISAADAVPPVTGKGPVSVPHCKVRGVIGTEIRFELLLPDTWNGRFVMGGGGGFVEGIDNQAIASINRGYATAGTDTGHHGSGIQASWALDHLERQLNYGYLGVHRTATVAKALVAAYYGRAARHAYFVGCSNGGRQGLMEAQRFPADFDGIVSGAPAYDFTRIAASFVTHAKATFPRPSSLQTSTVSATDLALVAAASLAACDDADGVADRVINDPRTCRFSLDAIKSCPNDLAAADCLTAASRRALATIYAPVTGPAGQIYPGQPVGGEADRGGWQQWITGVDPGLSARTGGKVPSLRHGFGSEFFKYFVYRDPSWDYTTFDVTTWARDTRLAATFLNADSVDLDGFKARKGKLLLWHGWSDAALNALSTIEYYDRLVARDTSAADYARFFLLPGVGHCGGGLGPDSVDWLDTLAAWVERGEPPTRVTAIKRGDGGAMVRSRPVCAHPHRAVYVGTGSTDDAASFDCRP